MASGNGPARVAPVTRTECAAPSAASLAAAASPSRWRRGPPPFPRAATRPFLFLARGRPSPVRPVRRSVRKPGLHGTDAAIPCVKNTPGGTDATVGVRYPPG